MPKKGSKILFLRFFPLLLCAVLFRGSLSADNAVEVSTKPAPARKAESPLMLNIMKDRDESRVGLDYSIRWDFSDLAKIRPNLKTLANGIAAVRNWDITENTRVKYYGFATNPWRIFIAREKKTGGAEPAEASAITSSGEGSPVYKKRLRLSLSPLVDDLKRNLDENLRNALLQSSLSQVKTVGPEWQKVGNRGKKEFMNDVLSLDIWRVPGLNTTRQGLEYISK